MKSQDFEDFEYDVAIEIPDCPTSNIINILEVDYAGNYQ